MENAQPKTAHETAVTTVLKAREMGRRTAPYWGNRLRKKLCGLQH